MREHDTPEPIVWTLRVLAASACLAVLAAPGCAPPRRASVGTECERNSDCDAPLVCRLGFCRNECATSADCGAGLSCVLTGQPGDPHRFGACQLVAETDCSLDSECPAGLVCRFNQCTNACNEDRDCPGGASCRIDPLGNACVDPSNIPCTLDGECGAGEFCLDGRCRPQCLADRDCRNDFWCDTSRAPPLCLPPPRPGRDAGPLDTGASDAPTADVPSGSGCAGPPLAPVAQYSVGDTHACAVVSGTGQVFCWGGVPGSGATPCATQITLPAALAGVVDSVVAGGTFTCVVTMAGEVWCDRGIAGAGLDFQRVGALTGVTRVAAGSGHACAQVGASVVCWGDNRAGQLGDATFTDASSTTPITVTAAPTSLLSELVLGARHSCVVSGAERSPRCWGEDATSQLGTMLSGLIGLDGLAAGAGHTAVNNASSVFAWGSNAFGELGDASASPRAMWATVPGTPGATLMELVAGSRHTCVGTGMDVHCWGRGTAIDGSGSPVTPTLLFSAHAVIEAGDDVTCAVRAGLGQIDCLGDNGDGQLGDGTFDARYVPMPVLRATP